ncbi:MAG: hypothetical protein COT85_03110 [Chlamydiae bacterium CG10_big_fil_rev_8_21_14_0_10_42_34]|nr:MAG: hypothetical protein COT85_03110 [Chlamydiae bacterium CG10_big_fil_rev_8_21_14_0_10_42_34]
MVKPIDSIQRYSEPKESQWSVEGLSKKFTSIFSSPRNPDDAINRIDACAKKGLDRAAVLGIKPESTKTRFQAALAKDLSKKELEKSRSDSAAERGPIARIDGYELDPVVTLAPTLKARVEAIDWKEKKEQNTQILIQKVSAFSALLQMRDGSGVDDKNNLTLMNLVKRATESESPQSLWNLFIEEYNPKLTFFQKIKAGWYYWAYYQTSLINNTVSAYLESFLSNLTDDLSKENSNTRSALFRKFLDNTNQFLINDLKATKDFAYETGDGDLDDYRNRAIDRHLGISIQELCKAFSEKRVDQDSPNVSFFATLQKIPVLGRIFKLFELIINRYVIQKLMKSAILPAALESVVVNGLKATEPQNLPFAISITKFLISRFEQLKVQLAKESGLDNKAKVFPGTEKLSATIAHLQKVISLEPFQTAHELRKKIEELDNKWMLDKKLDQVIEQGIVDAGNILFNYLNDAAKSGELFAHVLELSAAPFSGEEKDPDLLIAEYEGEQLKLEKLAEEVLGSIISTAVDKIISVDKSDNAKAIATASFEDKQIIALRTMDELNALCMKINEKIDQSANGLSENNNVHPEIASFFQVMQVFANRKEIQDPVDKLKPKQRNHIWKKTTPIYEKTVQINERMIRLQELQDQYASYTVVEKKLTSILEILASIKEQFHENPRHSLNPLIPSLKDAANEIKKHLGNDWGGAIQLKNYIDEINQHAENIVANQGVIDAIFALYPLRLEGDNDSANGLLDDLLSYHQGHYKVGFKPKLCLQEIGKYLEYFPEEARTHLKTLIGNGSGTVENWDAIGEVIQGVYTENRAHKNTNRRLLDELTDKVSNWLNEITVKYAEVKNVSHKKMKKKITTISGEISSLSRQVQTTELNFPNPYTPTQLKTRAAFASGATGIGAYLLGALNPIGALATAGFGAAFGWNYQNVVHHVSQGKVLPKVTEIFVNACKLMKAPRIYKAATTRILKELAQI